ncbi:MAG: ABC transporter substrate-binding protein [Gemmatimonadota bacterium]
MNKYLRNAAFLFGVTLSFVCGPALSQKLTVAEPGRLFQYSPLYFAVEKGYFKQEGLDVSILSVGRRDLAMKAVIQGQAFASVHDPVEASLAKSRGADVKLIAPVVNVAALWLTVDKDITLDSKSWRGKRIAIPTPPNTINSIFLKELRENGWVEVDRTTYKMKGDDDPSRYLRILYGAFGTELALMMNGQANMTVALEPTASVLVVKAGRHIIKDYPAVIGRFLNSTINVTAETIKNDRATVTKFINALTKAYRYAAKHPDELEQVALKWFPNTDPTVMRAAIQRMIKAGSFPADTIFTKESYYKNLEYLGLGEPNHSALQIKFEDIADTSFAEAASKAYQ